MGCFFGCFRVKDDKFKPQAHLVSERVNVDKTREALKSKNRLSTLLQSEERDDSLCKDEENHGSGSSQSRNADSELRDEAKFLKACGAILETPAEIRKTTKKLKGSPPDLGSSEFHSWLPNASMKKLQLHEQLDQPPTPAKLCEEWHNGSVSLNQTPSSCIFDSQNAGIMSRSSNEVSGQESLTSVKIHSKLSDDTVTPANVQRRTKSVRFDSGVDEALRYSSGSSSGSADQNGKKLESTGNHTEPKRSPYATPLELSDEMQTPGTVFPSNLDNTHSRKNARIRSQYVYSTLNPMGNLSAWNELDEEDSNSHKMSNNNVESLDESVNELEVDISRENHYFGRSPGDRPILGTVAAHWNEDAPCISQKMWDGNGIPNSTNKYKEDQKVSWHATPFEERLEKALSEESSVFQRKDFSGTTPMSFEDNDESDTAASHLQSLNHPKTVVSF